MNNYRRVLLIALLLPLYACVSSGPVTKFYSLFSDKSAEKVSFSHSQIALGIGPVVLPEYLDNPAVITLTGTQHVKVLGYHAWAGDFKGSISRVMADNISSSLSLDAVWAFPWDNRTRPDYQVRIVFDELAGIRGGNVSLSAKWTVLNKRGDRVISVGSRRLEERTASDSVDDYVAAINRAVNTLSLSISQALAQSLPSDS